MGPRQPRRSRSPAPARRSAPHPEESSVTRSPAETRRLAARLCRRLPARAVVALHGDLGSGKTCFVQGLAEALGIKAAVTSPTFTLVNEYRGDRPLVHIDLYRLSHPDEVLALGFEEYLLSDGITAVEWPDRAGDLLPADAWHVTLSPTAHPRHRRVTIRMGAG
jgi:tRNA threonylcarbamoyladenosine biosynthesis protein TsaE